jgi:MtrB/PioB family decaheme-associated outer membrane protein
MKRYLRITLSSTAVAALTAIAPITSAEDDEVTELTKPSSTISVGLGAVSDDNSRFGQYTGLREKGGYGLVDIDYVNRADDTGTWVELTGRNLGLPNRDLRFEHTRQGDWGYFLEFSQTPRYEPYTANTAVQGIGTNNLTVPATATAGSPVQLKTEREMLGLGFDKIMKSGVDFQLRFRNEQKDGARVFARGTTGGAGQFQFTPEPINSTTRQIEAILGYAGDKLQLSGGYYGTAYDNDNTALNVTEVGGASPLAGFTPIGLPPDNEAHQLYLSGGYSLSPTTRATFKAAYARQTQDDTFILPSAPGRTDLGGRVDTTQLQAGITARPLPKLSLLANLRYEDRDDKTPVERYFTGASTTSNGENEPRSIRTTNGKLEASYALPAAFRITGGVDYDEKKRNFSAVRVVSARETTEETSYRVELRRTMSETVTGALAYIHSKRDGSDFLTTTLTSGAAGSNLIAPLHLADRDRDKVRLSVHWMPTEPLSLQLVADYAQDDYSSRTAAELGLREGKAQNYSLDAGYAFTDAWQGTAWISRNDNRADQATQVGAPTGQFWAAALRNSGDAVGIGIQGKATSKLDVGADVQYSRIVDEFRQSAISGAAIADLPDITTRLVTVKLFTKYALKKNSGIRLDYIYDQFKTDDWTWSTWTYTDGTTLTQDPTQAVHFIGVTYYRGWQ